MPFFKFVPSIETKSITAGSELFILVGFISDVKVLYEL